MSSTKTHREHEELLRLRELWTTPEFRSAVDEEFPYAEVASSVIGIRAQFQLTQRELAARCGTTQSVIARLESGRHAVQVGMLRRIADAVGLRWRPVFEPPVVVDVFQGSTDRSVEDSASEVIDLAERRLAHAAILKWQMAPVRQRESTRPDALHTWPELREAMDRFVGSFAVTEASIDDEHGPAPRKSEYTAV